MGRALFRWGFGNRPDVLAGLGRLRGAGGHLLDEAAVRGATGLPATGTLNDLIESRHPFDPSRFAWKNPRPAGLSQPLSGAFNRLLTEPKDLGWWQANKLRSSLLAGRYGLNRAVNQGYRAKQWMMRNPNLSMTAAATPFAGMG